MCVEANMRALLLVDHLSVAVLVPTPRPYSTLIVPSLLIQIRIFQIHCHCKAYNDSR